MMRKIFLFFEVCIIAGLFILIFSIIGSKLIKSDGVFIGAAIGGILGIFLACKIAIRFALAKRSSFARMFLFSVFGFVLCVVITAFNLHNPLIVVSSTALIGIGTVIAVLFEK
jgi:hypothetical protein